MNDRTTLKGARKWKQEGDHTFTRMFGPVLARVDRHWGMTPNPTEYRAYLSICGQRCDAAFVVAIDSLDVKWFEDEADTKAVKALEKKIVAYIRSWVK